jgi:hypothetical protein
MGSEELRMLLANETVIGLHDEFSRLKAKGLEAARVLESARISGSFFSISYKAVGYGADEEVPRDKKSRRESALERCLKQARIVVRGNIDARTLATTALARDNKAHPSFST